MPRRARSPSLIAGLVALALSAGCGHEVRRVRYEGGAPWSEVRYKDGRPDGLWRTWWSNGRLKSEGEYRAGDLHGTWRTWFEDGAPQTEQTFVLGKPEGTWRHWYHHGQLVTEGFYRAGRKEGPWREWFGDGTLKAEGEFREGRPTGVASVHDAQGRLLTRTRYDAEGHSEHLEIFNTLDSTWARAEGPIQNDRRNGIWTVYNVDGSVNAEHSGTYVDDVLVKDAPR
jgi:antitoxin component YwqK of YwqJK toxin-antitoxin module